MKELQVEKEKEIKAMQTAFDKKEAERKKLDQIQITTLEKKVQQ